MSYARQDLRVITLDKQYRIYVWFEKSRSGFRHIAELHRGGCIAARTKCCYLNRTWESYKYASVLHALLHKYFTEKDVAKYAIIVNSGGKEGSVGERRDLAPLREVSALGALAGVLFSDNKQAEVKAKRAALESLPGIRLPDEFNSLPIDEQVKRLDGALAQCGKE